MPNRFIDTSALAKHYHAETGTAEVDHLWAETGSSLFISRLGVVEAVSVFASKVRQGVVSQADFQLIRRRFFADLRKRRPIVSRLIVRHFQEADRLLQQYSLANGLYSHDALQLAAALDLKRRGLIDELVASDRVVLNIARLERLNVFDPENP